MTSRKLAVLSWCAWPLIASALLSAQAASARAAAEYVIGPQDVLAINCYDQTDLSGKFTVEADGTFTYPLIGRFTAAGLTLRRAEAGLKTRLKDEGYFKNPQITVSVDQYRSQRVFVVGEVRTPGMYSLAGTIDLVEAMARSGSMLPTASGEAVIVHGGEHVTGPTMPTRLDTPDVDRVNLRDLEKGVFTENRQLRDGDTVFVPRAETIYVFGEVRTPGAYALQQRRITVLQALSLAGGVTERGALNRIDTIRVVNGDAKQLRVKLSDLVQAGDTLVVRERFF
jgi:polysaccharide biosynthesis/export protein